MLSTILLCGLCVFSLSSCCEILSEILGLNGVIQITSPGDGIIVSTSSVTVEVEATFDYIDEIVLEVNGTPVHTTSESSFSHTVSLEPSADENDWNTITATCYAFDSDTDTTSEYAGSDTIRVFYDNQDPVLTITYPVNWSVIPAVPPADVTIEGTVEDNFGIEALSYLDDGEYIQFENEAGAWNLLFEELSATTHSFLFKAEDVAGRTVVNTVTFTIAVP